MNKNTKSDISKKEKVDEIFEIVADKLNEHEIDWWLTAGSMLGCYREGSRIKWDDEYDIAYPVEQAQSVLEALLEIDDVFIDGNLHFKVEEMKGILSKKHYMCVKPHVFSHKGVYKVNTPLRSLASKINKLNIVGTYTFVFGSMLILNKFIRKLPLDIQKVIAKVNMNTWIPLRFRGTKQEYSSWYKTKMDDVTVKLPTGVESILERLYGEDFMTPKKRGEYELGGNMEDFPLD